MKRLLLPLFALGLLLSGCQSTNQRDGTIAIGFIGPLTGEASPYGVDTLAGVQLKVDEINAKGGIDGRMLKLISEDGRCTGADAASAAQKLIHVDDVFAIIGGQCSGETLALAPIAEAAEVLVISPISSNPDVTEAGDFVFRNYPSDALKTESMAAYFAEHGLQKIAIISENTDFASGFRSALVADVGEENVVFDEIVEPGTKDYRTLMTRLQEVDFDVFVANGQFPASIAAMLQQMREMGIEQQAISHDVGDSIELMNIAGEAAEGFRVIASETLSEESAFAQLALSKDISPQSSFVFMAHAYDAMGVLAEAISHVGVDSGAVRDYLYTLDGYEGAVGTFSFDEYGDVVGLGYDLKEVQDGAFVTIDAISVE